MEELFAHDTIRCAIFAHLAYDEKYRAQSATLLAQYRWVSREWARAIPPMPKFCAYVHARAGAVNPAASGDIIAMRAMFYETSIVRWILSVRAKYDEQSAQIRAVFGATCGIVPASRDDVLGVIESLARSNCTVVGDEPCADVASDNEIIVRLRTRDRICEICDSPTFAADLQEAREHPEWHVPIESKLILFRDAIKRSRTSFEKSAIMSISASYESTLCDPQLIDFCLSTFASYSLIISEIGIFHLEKRADVARVVEHMCGIRECINFSRIPDQHGDHSRLRCVYGHLRMFNEQ
jgi:hypothetical protein